MHSKIDLPRLINVCIYWKYTVGYLTGNYFICYQKVRIGNMATIPFLVNTELVAHTYQKTYVFKSAQHFFSFVLEESRCKLMLNNGASEMNLLLRAVP